MVEGVRSGVWSPDGEWLLLTRNTGQDGDIMVMRLGVDSVPQPLIATGLSEGSPALSPDGRWLAYTTQELEGGGRSNVFVSPFPNSDEGRWQVSTDSDGNIPFWSNTGRELFYRLSGGGVAAVDVSTSPRFQPGIPRVLFRLANDPRAGIDISPDDDRFVMVAPLASARHDPDFIVVQNFLDELKRLVPN
jgi:Tol biopolymer transport system component